ncbi:MAG: nickel uptake regulator, Fur family [Frankiales bacterium]|nr:nickel uptake regulator, Fur family [Frankiales bacterium]
MGKATSAPDAAERLRAAGHRVTKQRLRVLEAVAELGHATPEQVRAAVGGDADLATVYRALTLLEDLGLVQHTHLGHGSPTWSVRAEDVAHVHLMCQRCGQLVEVEAAAVRPLVQAIERKHGFSIDLGHLSLSGKCLQCRTKQDKTP